MAWRDVKAGSLARRYFAVDSDGVDQKHLRARSSRAARQVTWQTAIDRAADQAVQAAADPVVRKAAGRVV